MLKVTRAGQQISFPRWLLKARHPAYALLGSQPTRCSLLMARLRGLGGHIPAFKQKFVLSDSALSMVLLAVAAGSIVSMPLADKRCDILGVGVASS